MKNRPLGCLTVNGMTAAALMIVFVVVFGLFRDGALFSPGKLNAQSGASLGGVSSHSEIIECSACHAAFWSADRMTGRCLSCHIDIGEQVDSGTGLHGILIENREFACQDCHTEHNGPQASLTEIDTGGFPHDATGFSLRAHEGLSGGALDCEDCHDNFSSANLDHCFECHEMEDPTFTNEHAQSFGLDCLECHDGIDTLAEEFDHDSTGFPLLGEHQQAACSGCHLQQASLEAVRQTSQTCFDCHAADDIHRGAFGEDCQVCHTPVGWEVQDFDHSITGFPLVGRHAGLECSDCHETQNLADTEPTCASCHLEDDAHNGDFGLECEGCHVPEDWDQVTFDHNLTEFPLIGRHADVDCLECHELQNPAGAEPACASCHLEDDAHDGEFGFECESCHSPEDWDQVTFDHNLSNFPLTGAHAAAACTDCHQDGFGNLLTDCASCHVEPAIHAGLFESNCASCHTTAAWLPAEFNLPHSFPFNHGDAGGNCQTCHPTALTTYNCYNCHEHEPNEIREEHEDEDIFDFANCTSCHPNGEEDEADDD